jgi:hypothetical protein
MQFFAQSPWVPLAMINQEKTLHRDQWYVHLVTQFTTVEKLVCGHLVQIEEVRDGRLKPSHPAFNPGDHVGRGNATFKDSQHRDFNHPNQVRVESRLAGSDNQRTATVEIVHRIDGIGSNRQIRRESNRGRRRNRHQLHFPNHPVAGAFD